MMSKPVVTFRINQGFDQFRGGGWYIWLAYIKGHPRLGDHPYIHTSLLLNVKFADGTSIQFDEGMNPDFKPYNISLEAVVEIETLNTMYVKEVVDQGE